MMAEIKCSKCGKVLKEEDLSTSKILPKINVFAEHVNGKELPICFKCWKTADELEALKAKTFHKIGAELLLLTPEIDHLFAVLEPYITAREQAARDSERAKGELYKKALEADASDLWRVTTAIKKEIAAREWIMEGRGCYEWDDNRYKDETRLAFEAVLKLIKEVQHPAQLRFQQAIRGGK